MGRKFFYETPGNVCVCDMSLDDLDLGWWITQTLHQAVQRYKRVVYRPHPLQKLRRLNLKIPPCIEIHHNNTIEHSLVNAICCLTYSSNSAVDAVMAGVPVMTQGRASMAKAISSKKVSDPLKFPDRSDWLRRLAYCQWTPAEVAEGKPWAHLRKGLRQ